MVNDKDMEEMTLHQVSTGSCPGFSRKVCMYALNCDGTSNEHIIMPTKTHFNGSSCNRFCITCCTSSSIQKWTVLRWVLGLMQLSPAACHVSSKAFHAVINLQDVVGSLTLFISQKNQTDSSSRICHSEIFHSTLNFQIHNS